ncbi:MAG TPA: glycosyltransferase family 39 protein, partial [Dongiaceae bacterium]
LSQLFIAATYGFVYLLGRDLIGARGAAAGTLLLAACFYFSWPTPEFNHNVAQMPIWAAIAFVLWRAAARNALWFWLVAGLLAALGMYAKFSTGVLLLCAGVWLLADRRGRACLSTYKPWLGLGVFGAASLPLAIRLVETGYRPLLYAENASAGGAGILHFLSTQVADYAATLVIVLLAFPWRRSASADDLANPEGVDEPTALRFLLIVGLGPLLTTALIALAHGAEDMWGAPMLNLVGLLAILPLRRLLSQLVLRRIAAAALFLAVVVPLAYAGMYLARFEQGEAHAPRPLWPQATIAERMSDIWRRATNAPLRIVGGSPWLAGLVALTAPDQPTIYANFDQIASPWISDERLAREGVLVVWEDRDGLPPAGRALVSGRTAGEEDFRWSP